MKSSFFWLGITFLGSGISLVGFGRTMKAAIKEQEHAQRMATIRAFNSAVAESEAHKAYQVVGTRGACEVRDYGVNHMTDEQLAYEDAIKHA